MVEPLKVALGIGSQPEHELRQVTAKIKEVPCSYLAVAQLPTVS